MTVRIAPGGRIVYHAAWYIERTIRAQLPASFAEHVAIMINLDPHGFRAAVQIGFLDAEGKHVVHKFDLVQSDELRAIPGSEDTLARFYLRDEDIALLALRVP